MAVSLADIEEAAGRLAGQVVRTPMLRAAKLSALLGCELFIKFENLQVTNSFKDRGAYNKLVALDDAERRRGVIAMSAGNHAQAVAYHASRLGIPATIVMPQTTPFTKIERTRAHGAEIVLSGETLADAQVKAEEIIADKGLVLVHPYDDDRIIAGQGTIGLEMVADEPDLAAIVAPIGGGGMISGVAIAAHGVNPEIDIHGVEVELYPSMSMALKGRQGACGGSTLAEGIAVKNVTERTVSICREHLKEVILVGEAGVEQAVNMLLAEQKTLAEGAGAAGLAAIMANAATFAGRKVAMVLSGGNIDTRILASIIYRELEREHRIVNLRVEIDDRPGMLGRIATVLGDAGANILEVSHRRMYLDIPAKGAQIDLMIETRDADHADEITQALAAEGFKIEVLDSPGGRAQGPRRGP